MSDIDMKVAIEHARAIVAQGADASSDGPFALARALLALHTRVEAMAAVVAAAEVWRDEMERIALLAVDHESKNMSRRVAHDLLYEAITFNGPTGGAK